MRKFLNRITTVASDISKHIVGAVYILWGILVITVFLGDLAGLIACGVAVISFIVWELMGKTKFSVKDILSAVIVILPYFGMLLKHYLS